MNNNTEVESHEKCGRNPDGTFADGHKPYIAENPGRPPKGDSIREAEKMFLDMSDEERESFRCKTTAQIIAKKRVKMAIDAEEHQPIDTLADQVCGKPKETKHLSFDTEKLIQFQETFDEE